MPKWILTKPPHDCEKNENLFAAALNAHLGSDWTVRWGYHYERSSGVSCEGDFLVLGPYGGICVFEVKTSVYLSPQTGEWSIDGEAARSSKHPFDQLLDQHKAIVQQFRAHAEPHEIPFIQKALVLPELEIDRDLKEYRTVPTESIVDALDLEDFFSAWDRLFNGRKVPVSPEQKNAFLKLFAEHMDPKEVRRFISHTDHQIYKRTLTNHTWVDSLSKNQQLVVEGGVGSGKTWMALYAAKNLASRPGETQGRRVLVMVYNIALGKFLRSQIKRGDAKNGQVEVYTFEELCEAICATAELDLSVYKQPDKLQEYYQKHLLEAVALALQECPKTREQWCQAFDALVVDEAQDHNTCLPLEIEGLPLGFWSIYVKLLKEGFASKMVITGDPHQRPMFRDDGHFNVDRLREKLSQAAYLQLHETKRYTRQIAGFLKRLRGEGSLALANRVFLGKGLEEGPDVIEVEVSAERAVQKVESILHEWHQIGWCECQDVLILYPRTSMKHSVLGELEKLGKHPVQPLLAELEGAGSMAYSHCSIHKAKGIDSCGVILVGMKKYQDLEKAYDQFTYFMGASRARQLLACVHIEE